MGMLIFWLILTVLISCWNAYCTGKAWYPAMSSSLWMQLVTWSGAIMSAVGFTYVFMFVIGFVAVQADVAYHASNGGDVLFTETMIEGYMSLGYIILYFPLVTSGIIITIHSWQVAREQRGLGDYMIAGWNTYATVSNIIDGVRFLPEIFSNVGNMFEDTEYDDDDASGVVILIVLAMLIASVALGILLARAIILLSARSTMQYAQFKYEDRIRATYGSVEPKKRSQYRR